MKNLFGLLLSLMAIPLLLSAQIPSGYVARYTLNNTANDIGGVYNGTLTSVAGTTDRLGNTNGAIQLTSGSSYGTLPVVVKDNFSIGFWLKTTMTASSSSQWYGGNSLIDAEVCGVTNDWGVALINGGAICFGTGNPDKTLISPATNYNNGAWHFVTVTRDETGTGTMTLYVDGGQVASLTNVNKNTLTAPTFIGLGRNNCTGPDYTGSLDDLILYNRVLSSSEVTSLFNDMTVVALSLSWMSFTGEVSGNKINLQWETGDSKQNELFEIERSQDGVNFSTIGTVNDVNTVEGNISSAFEDVNPATGINYYRIKNVNLDGTYSYSKIINLTFQVRNASISLLSNPVSNDMVIIKNPGEQLVREINIFDLSGRVIARKKFNSQTETLQMELNNLMHGFYFVQVITTKNNVSLPFIKLH